MKTSVSFSTAVVQEMAQSDVRALISEERYRAIKSQDPHPLFTALSMAHEGKSFGRIIGIQGAEKGAEKIWPRSRIHELVNWINKMLDKGRYISGSTDQARRPAGVPVYMFHNRDNSPRNPVGRLVAAVSRRIRGRVHALGIAYISDPHVRERIRKGELDTCSIEAELEFQTPSSGSTGRQWIVNAVKKISGVALGSSVLQRPGFTDAGILAAVQEFDADPDDPGKELKVLELEKKLNEREKEIENLEAELRRLKDDADSNERAERAVSLGEKLISVEQLSPAECSFIMDDLRKNSHSFGKDNGGFEAHVEDRVRKQLERLERVRRHYSSTLKIPAPPERGPENGERGIISNPLIPRR